MLCCRHRSAVDNPASPCFRIAMICSSLCRVPFTLLLLPAQHVTLAMPASVTSLVRENSHCRRSSFWGLGHCDGHASELTSRVLRPRQDLAPCESRLWVDRIAPEVFQ